MDNKLIVDADGKILNKDYQGPGVYQIEFTETKKIYIGATKNIKIRLNEHLRSLNNNKHSNRELQKLFNTNEHTLTSVFAVKTEDIAFSIEKELIKEHRKDESFLNIRGSKLAPMSGRKMPPEYGRNISIRLKEKYSTGELVSYMKGKHHTDEAKEKLSIKHKQNYKEGYVNPFFGKTHNVENKQKQKILVKNQWESKEFKNRVRTESQIKLEDQEYRKKLSVANTNKIRNKKVVTNNRSLEDSSCEEKRLAVLKEWYNDPINKLHHKHATKLGMCMPGVKEKISSGVKEYYNANKGARKAASERVKVRMQNPDNRELSRISAKIAWEDPIYRENLIKKSKEKWQDPVYRKSQCKSVIVDGITYDSVKEAIIGLGISNSEYYKQYGNKIEGVT